MTVDATKSLPLTYSSQIQEPKLVLPDDIIREIFKNIENLETLQTVSSICEKWSAICSEQDVCLAVLQRAYPHLPARELINGNPKNWLIALKNFESFKHEKTWTLEIKPTEITWDKAWDLYGNDLFKPEGSNIVKYNIEDGQKTGEFIGHEQPVTRIKLVRQHLFSASKDLSVKMWDLKSGACLQTFTGHTDYVYCIKTTLEHLFTSAHDRTAKKWDITTGVCLRTFAYDNNYWFFKLKNSIPHLFSKGFKKTPKMWNIESGEIQQTYEEHQVVIRLKVVDIHLFTCSSKNTVKIWDLASGVHLKTFPASGLITTMKIKGNNLFIGSYNKSVTIWDIKKSEVIRFLAVDKHLKLVGINLKANPDFSIPGILKVVDTTSGKCLKEISDVKAFRFTAGRLFVWGDTQAQIFDFNH